MPTTDPARLHALTEELGKKPSYAIGDRRLPSPVTEAEAIDIATALSHEVDDGVKMRARLAASRKLQIHCHAGCNDCCNVVVMVWAPEAERIAEFLRRPNNAAALAHFTEQYRRWRDGLADVLPALSNLSANHKDQAPYFDLLADATRRRVLCAFDRDGRCVVYPVRPLGCRNAHALDTAARCAGDHKDGAKAAALEFAPLDSFMVDATRLLRAAHNSMADTTRHHAEALCRAVARRLGLETAQDP